MNFVDREGKSNNSTLIPASNKHRLPNPGTVDLGITELRVGSFLGGDNIVRFDDMGRRKQ